MPPPQRQPWKRCASHVYIAHFIDMQQQITRHPFFTAANLYGAKSYNLNVPLPPAESVFGSSVGGPLGGNVTGPPATSSAAAATLEANERGLNAAAIAVASAASIQAVKERAYNMEVLNRKPPAQQQQTAQHQSPLSLQVGSQPKPLLPVTSEVSFWNRSRKVSANIESILLCR